MKRSRYFLCLTLPFLFFASASVTAEVKLPALFSNNMVLQQNKHVPIWGWADPGEEVRVIDQSQTHLAKTNDKGEWKVYLAPRQAGGPYSITIEASNSITLKNILFGEVWVCSGQSNMEWPVIASTNSQEEIVNANFSNIRHFTVKKTVADHPQKDVSGQWSVCSPKSIPGFSAVAYFFGRQLHQSLDVPIGLIDSSWGGTPAEAWTSMEHLGSDPDLQTILGHYGRALKIYPTAKAEYDQRTKQWEKDAEQAKSQGQPAPPRTFHPPMGPEHQHRPSGLYNGMLAPLAPYALQGVIWYQGESNAAHAWQYRKLFPAMIQNWRIDFQQGDFPFLFVQLASYDYGPANKLVCAELREAQRMTLDYPNTGMAVTTDISNIKDIHPKNKQDVGKRLALWALANTYGQENIVYSGPLYKSIQVEGNKIRVAFDHVGGGLLAKGEALTDFTVAGSDQKFYEAVAIIDGDTVVVHSDKVSDPVAVRFGWSNLAEPNLFNQEGLPASPFSSDDWPGVTFSAR